jgi:hypothetical protein
MREIGCNELLELSRVNHFFVIAVLFLAECLLVRKVGEATMHFLDFFLFHYFVNQVKSPISIRSNEEEE